MRNLILASLVLALAHAASAQGPMLAGRDDAPATTADKGLGIVRMTGLRDLHVVPFNSAGTESGTVGNPLAVNCTVGCSGGTTDTDDGSVAGGQSTGINIGLGYMWNGAAWIRQSGDVTNGLDVDVTRVSGSVTVTDGAGALNVICDSGCAGGTTDTDDDSVAGAQVTGLQIGLGYQWTGAAWQRIIGSATDGLLVNLGTNNDVTITSGTLTAVTTITNPVAVTGTFWQATQPVSGTVAVSSVGGTVTVTDGAGAMNVIVDSSALPSGAATAANQTSVIGTDGLAGPASVLSAGGTQATGEIEELRVDSDGNLQVDILTAPTITVTDGAGAMNVIVDSGTLTAVTSITNSVTVTDGAGALNVICDSGCTPGGSFADNAAFTFGTTAINVAGYVVDDTSTNAATENSAAAPRMSTNRVAYSQLRDAAGNERGANVTAGFALVVDGSGSTQPVSATNLDIRDLTSVSDSVSAAQSGTWNIGTVTTVSGATITTFPDNEPFNLAQITGSTAQIATAALDTTGAGLLAAAITAQLDDAATSTVTENQFAHVRLSSARRLLVDGSGVTQPVSGTVTATATDLDIRNLVFATDKVDVSGSSSVGVTGTFFQATQPISIEQTGNNNAVDVLTLPAVTASALSIGDGTNPVVVLTDGADNLVNTNNQLITGAHLYAFDGATWDRMLGNSTDGLLVNLGTNNDVTVTGSVTATVASTTVTAAAASIGKAEDAAHADLDVGVPALAVRDDTLNIRSGAENDYEPLHTDANGGLWTRDIATSATGAAPPASGSYAVGLGSGGTGGFLVGIPVCDSFFPVDIVTATTTLAVTGVAGRHVRICSLNLITAAANNVAIIAGTNGSCGTSTAGMNGGVTAAEGWNLAANGGIALGSGLGTVMRTETTGDSVCIITSAATQLSGTLAYTIF